MVGKKVVRKKSRRQLESQMLAQQEIQDWITAETQARRRVEAEQMRRDSWFTRREGV